ncbi:MAG: nuclear transport factor 2 family protein [Fimbriimonas sp.]|nr:nuclear transport factor 2 family protein [Fimbriimonas sp.]
MIFKTALFALLMLGSMAFASTDDVKKQLDANYEALGAAFKRKDMGAFAKFYADDFVSLDAKGKSISRSNVLSTLGSEMKVATSVEWKRKVTKVTVSGGLATATVSGYFAATLPMPDKKSHKIQVRTLNENVWKRVGHSWLMKRSKPISSTLVQDGHLMTRTVRRRVIPPK